MKIEALTRLISVSIVPQSTAFSEAHGKESLELYSKRPDQYVNLNRKIVKTNISGFTIEVDKLGVMYDIFLVHDGKAVGLLALTPSSLLRHVYIPASFFAKAYRGLGYAKALYKWVLDNKMSLLSDTTQSKYSSALWQSLIKEYENIWVTTNRLGVELLPDSDLDYFTEPGARMILIQRGLGKDQFIKENKIK